MTAREGLFGSLVPWRSTAFLVGGLLMVVDAGIVAGSMVQAGDDLLLLGQAFVGTAWTAALLGLLGLYPGLADRSRWLSRTGAACAAIGVVVFAVMAVTSLVYYAGIPSGSYDAIGQLFIPGVLIGSVLGFVLFSVASLRTGVHSQAFGLLLLVPPFLVLTNILRFVAGMEAVSITLGIVVADALAMLTLGYVLRTQPTLSDQMEAMPDSTAR